MDPRDMEPLDITDPAALDDWGPATPEEEEALVEAIVADPRWRAIYLAGRDRFLRQQMGGEAA